MDWKDKAVELYKQGIKITDIAVKVGKSRKSVSKHINSLPDAEKLHENKKKISEERHREQKRKWKDRTTVEQSARLKSQHDIDVRVLSYERIYGE